MENEELKEINNKIVSFIDMGKQGYENFTALEKFRYADSVMACLRDYCCSIWGMDKHSISIYFFNSSKMSGANFDEQNGGYAFGISTDEILMGNPYNLFLIGLHDLRHIYQETNLSVDDKNTEINYGGKNYSDLKWYSSGCEIDADRFSYATFYKFLLDAKQEDSSVNNFDLIKFKFDQIKVMGKHGIGGKLYEVMSVFSRDAEVASIVDSEETEDELRCLQIEDIQELAENYNVFNVQPKNAEEGYDNTVIIALDIIDIIDMELDSEKYFSQQSFSQGDN